MTPNDWRFLIGLPTTVEGWLTCRDEPSRFDFWRQAGDSANRFDREFALPARRQLSLLKCCGCDICQCEFDDLSPSLQGKDTITLIAHWDKNRDNRIELADGLHDWKKVADVIIASGFRGTLDLCVCHPEPMVPYLKQHSDITVKHVTSEKSIIVLWLGIYGLMAAKIGETPMSFSNALVAAACELGQAQIIQTATEPKDAER